MRRQSEDPGVGFGLAGRFEAWWTQGNDTSEFLRDGLIALDANTLLHLYRVTPATREQVLSVFTDLADRIWVPHHAALEFHRHRVGVVTTRTSQFSQLRGVLQRAAENAATELQKAVDRLVAFRQANMTRRTWDAKSNGLTRDDFLARLEGAMDPAIAELAALEFEYDLGPEDMQGRDPVLERLDQLTIGKIGPSFSQGRIAELVREASEFRYPNKVPPGYEDAKSKSTAYLAAGDYILWRQLIEQAASSTWERVTLVTIDVKEDWWDIDKRGHPKRARPDLQQEFYESTGSKLNIMTLSEFLTAVAPYTPAGVSEETVKEVRSFELEVELANAMAELFGSDDDPEVPENPDLFDLTLSEFERLIALLLSAMKFDDVTRLHEPDSGFDIVAFDTFNGARETTLIEAKRYRHAVSLEPVMALYGAIKSTGADKGVLFTTSHFGEKSHAFVSDKPIRLVDGPELLELLQIHLGIDATISVHRHPRDGKQS
ncbi:MULTISPECIES: PIN-like domain-containing protein [unclassified Micromonospora]|uniref:PIN-like domain-containing protein n=1 Tax=unclassified Micromonospora TaxID=2617518 RepID=UPI0033235D01